MVNRFHDHSISCICSTCSYMYHRAVRRKRIEQSKVVSWFVWFMMTIAIKIVMMMMMMMMITITIIITIITTIIVMMVMMMVKPSWGYSTSVPILNENGFVLTLVHSTRISQAKIYTRCSTH